MQLNRADINSDELRVIIVSLSNTIDESKAALGDKSIPWNPHAKNMLTEILKHAESAKKKLEQVTNGGKEILFGTIEPGDEKEFLNPQP